MNDEWSDFKNNIDDVGNHGQGNDCIRVVTRSQNRNPVSCNWLPGYS